MLLSRLLIKRINFIIIINDLGLGKRRCLHTFCVSIEIFGEILYHANSIKYNLIFETARETWRKNYFSEKKKTGPLDEANTQIKRQLEAVHKRILSQMQTAGQNQGQLSKDSANSNATSDQVCSDVFRTIVTTNGRL